jgi:DNA polymerase III alpha subunit
MPLIYSGGVRQTPWTEGQHVRHLEPMGFIKFDILGLGTLRMIEDAIALSVEAPLWSGRPHL